MVKLRKRSDMHRTLQNTIVATINDPTYSFSLPKLSDWESIVSSSAGEKQRLEFVGDAVMHLSVALYLYRLFPDAAPGLYTNIRSAVNTNATFTHLMVKAGAYELPTQSHSSKAVADSFEIIVAALYLERGFADVCAWVQEQYTPLIAAARESYDKCLTKSGRSIPFLSTKRRRGPLDPAGTPLLKKIRLSSGHSSPRSTLMAQRVINRMKSKGKVKLCLPTRKSGPLLEMRLRSCERRTPELRKPSLVIDLTVDNKSDEGPAPSNTAQAPLPSIKSFDLSQTWHHPSEYNATSRSGQNTCKCIDVHWPPKQSSTASSVTLSQPSPGPSSPSTSSPIATPLDHTASIFPQAALQFYRRPDRLLPLHPNSIHVPSGTYGNPIVIED